MGVFLDKTMLKTDQINNRRSHSEEFHFCILNAYPNDKRHSQEFYKQNYSRQQNNVWKSISYLNHFQILLHQVYQIQPQPGTGNNRKSRRNEL